LDHADQPEPIDLPIGSYYDYIHHHHLLLLSPKAIEKHWLAPYSANIITDFNGDFQCMGWSAMNDKIASGLLIVYHPMQQRVS